MLRKESVYLKLKELTECVSGEKAGTHECGFSAGEIAALLNLDRTNVSRDLNNLVSEGRVTKLSGRPVKFLIKND